MINWINFFAYGELMNENYFKEQGLEYHDKFSVTLSAYRLVFNKIPYGEGNPEGLCHRNIEPTPDNLGMMHGIMYEMEEKFLERLDEIHHYPKEYTRKVMRITKHDFTLVNAYTYIAQHDRTQPGLKPSKAMLKIMREARNTMPMLYFSRIMKTRTID